MGGQEASDARRSWLQFSTLMSTDNYMTESAMEAEYMDSKYRAARENWVIFEVAFITFLAGGFLGVLMSRYPALAVVLGFGAIVFAVAGEYWRREMRKWD